MVTELFVTQFDGCDFKVNGVPSSGFNCTCAANAMFLYRATGGKVHTTSCHVRTLTGDHVDGTHLGQMEDVNRATYGVTGGKVYRPASFSTWLALIATNRYGSHLNISYRSIAGTKYDCFSNRFKGNHDYFISGPGPTGTLRVGDPGANGRRPGIPNGFQNIPITILRKAAGQLDLGGHPLGDGLVYAYVTPPDPASSSPKYHATVIHPTSLWNDGSKRWVYNGPNRRPVGTALIVRGATYVKGGVACFPVDASSPNYPGYYVPKVNVKLGAKV